MSEHRLIWWNGELVPWDSATVHVTSETAMRGLNVFEGIRAYWRPAERCYAIVALDAHLDRLQSSARLLQFPASDIVQRLADGIGDLLRSIPEPADLYLRPTIYVDAGGYEIDPSRIKVGAFISWREAPRRADRLLKCTLSTWRRIPAASLPPSAKIGASYTAFRFARLEAAAKGFDEAILLNCEGAISETAGGSVFGVNGRVFATPPLEAGILSSITRRLVLDRLCPELGFVTDERAIMPDELRSADAAMIVGTLDEVSRVASFDDHAFPAANDSSNAILEVARLYQAYCTGAHSRLADWIHVVPRASRQ